MGMGMVKGMVMVNKMILITGGAGFIGSNLVEYFLGKGAKVRVLDNLSTGYWFNIEAFKDHPNFTFIEGDIRDLNVCREATTSMNYVLHHAALGSVPRSIEHPELTNEVNVDGFLNMLIAAKDAKVKRFVYAASSSTYGDSKELPKVESKIGKPLSPYGVTKLINELYADVFNRVYGLECVGLRYFNVFGKRQDPDGTYAAVIPLFIKQLINHESPLINGSGNNSRDFTYIDNVIQMNELAMTTASHAAINTVYNTAVGERITLNDLFLTLKELLSVYDPAIAHIKANHGPLRDGDISHSLASIRKAASLLGYKPTHSFRKGLVEAIDWYWKNLTKEPEKKSMLE